jgi:hypothetical protein
MHECPRSGILPSGKVCRVENGIGTGKISGVVSLG